MSENDLWGDIEEVKLPRNPKVILKEQADAIGRKTKYVVRGKVIGSSELVKGSPSFRAALIIVTPRLDNYTYDLLLASYPLEMYPLKILSFPHKLSYECNTEEEFIEKLREILSSEEVMKTIAALVSQGTT